ncbi:MAG: Hydrolase, alpha/beta fold family [Ktedonobacterales bacterium]|jgi:pimeloyl-ACP methyl ester carboxylesterase|nr:MAG: Hydrolase, alpha/beta fold family [Ktedonobacterales bacterium]
MADDTRFSPTTESAATTTPPGSRFPLLPGVRSRMIATSRLAQHIYESGQPDAEPLVLIHGNASSARFYEELMASLPQYYIVAPDLRGYGATESRTVDATRGLRDFSDDLHALIEALRLARFHLLGWSLGGNIAMHYLLDHPERVRTLTLQAPGSPYGFGCTHGPDGQPNYDDFAGSGAGLISPDLRTHYEAKDTTADSPFSPRSALRTLYVKPGFQYAPEREDILVEQMLLMTIGDNYYPGDSVPSPNWPFRSPGVYGANNALSPKYLNQSGLADLERKPPILWIRGADDQVVSDASLADPGNLGKLGVIPGWPGDEVYPSQPMLAQLRAVLDRYAAQGGLYREEVIAACGHSPVIEHPDEFRALLTAFLRAAPADTAAPTQPPAEPSTPAVATPSSDETPHRKRGLLDFLRCPR